VWALRLTPSASTAEEVFQNLLEDVDYFPWQYIIFCQNFSKSRRNVGMNVQFRKFLVPLGFPNTIYVMSFVLITFRIICT
jgi:hypothetical protein